ncbi:hypothetical protein GP476_07520 [Aeromonas dhakensis]|uniref:hypothetical protein n=1 Tax=Aeromonas dhakensis TaxID=196024 RepID=UPI0021B1BAF4|nr:hypothetical protein [Aeromonas dhakensis]UXB11302.1 hypothetical protein GP476_07520 [Aeromonas dhakensis]
MENHDMQKFAERFSLMSICSNNEINRILNVSNARDHLLKLRADTIADHMRLYRVYRNKAINYRGEWSLEKSFSNSHYTSVISKLPKEERVACQSITFGDMFSDDPNGMIFPTQNGVITTISDSLRYFSMFSNLALLKFNEEVPTHVRMNALRIALRVMLRTESMDFYMDPRGTLPESIQSAINQPIFYQLQFLAGHEFSHYLLGHLTEDNVSTQAIFHALSPSTDEPLYNPQTVFNNSQKDELSADIYSIKLPRYSNRHRSKILDAALLFFTSLELYEVAKECISPRCPWIPKTHPSARERYENLLYEMKVDDRDRAVLLGNHNDVISTYSDFIQEDIATGFENYEVYGSIYLDEPNTKWRGRKLIDRVDYY